MQVHIFLNLLENCEKVFQNLAGNEKSANPIAPKKQ